MLNELLKKLRQPYPADFSPRCYLKYGVYIGLFVCLVFAVNQPFGLVNLAAQIRYPLYAGYGLISFSVITIFYLIFPRLLPGWFNEERWTTGRHILSAALITLGIGLASYALTRWLFLRVGLLLTHFNLTLVLTGTLFIGAFLITIITLVNLNMMLRRNALTVTEANRRIDGHPVPDELGSGATDKVELLGENQKEAFQSPLADLLYIAAEENYVEIHFKKEKVQHLLLRSSLTRIEQQVAAFRPKLFRCHRAYIVNIGKIRKVSGNAQGFKLTLEDTALRIPVARRYLNEFRRLVLPRL